MALLHCSCLRLFTLFCFCWLLCVSPIYSQQVIVTVEQPYRTETTAEFAFYGVEAFNNVTEGHHGRYESKFNSPGFESWIRGPYNDKESIRGTYTNLQIAINSDNGAAGPTSKALMQSSATDVTELLLTSTGPWGINYFGFSGLRLSPGDRMEFSWGESNIFDLDLAEVENFISARGYLNPDPLFKDLSLGALNPDPRGPDPRFAFVNIFFEDALINKVKILRSAPLGQFETARHTVGFYTVQAGAVVPVTSAFVAPTDPFPSLAAAPRASTRKAISPRVEVSIEEPEQSFTSSSHRLCARPDFSTWTPGSYKVDEAARFLPSGLVEGIYSANFDLVQVQNFQYFSTNDSLLSLKVAEGKRLRYFGLLAIAMKPGDVLEFYLKGESSYRFYFADLINAVQSTFGYFDSSRWSGLPAAYPGKASAFVNFLFHDASYDAVRFWSLRKNEAPANADLDFRSENHLLCTFIEDHDRFGGTVMEPAQIRTTLRMSAKAAAEEAARAQVQQLLSVLSTKDINDLGDLVKDLGDNTILETGGEGLVDELVAILGEGKAEALLELLSNRGAVKVGDGRASLETLETRLGPIGTKQLLDLFPKVDQSNLSLSGLQSQRKASAARQPVVDARPVKNAKAEDKDSGANVKKAAIGVCSLSLTAIVAAGVAYRLVKDAAAKKRAAAAAARREEEEDEDQYF